MKQIFDDRESIFIIIIIIISRCREDQSRFNRVNI